MKENLDYPYYLVRDRFAHADTDTLDDVHKGEGKSCACMGRNVQCIAMTRSRDGVFPGLHASEMPCPLERGRSYLGLSLPRLALPCDRGRAEWAGGGTARASRPCRASGMTGLTWQLRIGCRDHISKAVSKGPVAAAHVPCTG